MKGQNQRANGAARPEPADTPAHDPYAALRHRDFRYLLVGRFVASFGEQMVLIALGWELWLRTKNELALGLVGLVQVIPVILFSLPGGHVADQYNRKTIVLVSQVVLAACAVGLAIMSATQGPLWLIYLFIFCIGCALSFNNPATSSLLPQTIPSEAFTSAATWSSSAWQLASMLGPALAGAVVGITKSATPIYVIHAFAMLIAMGCVSLIKSRPVARQKKAATLASLAEGLRFIRNTKIILAAITLDMVAVLLGGATTLLPVFATDILKVGPEGLGVMRAAPSVGALVMTLTIAHLPPFRRAGRSLLLAVIGFGLATIVFGLSTNFWLSLAMLLLLGALDNISVVIRSTLMLTHTPDAMRGRASAVNSIFIGTSNELGGFESGATAALFGPVLSVVAGGIGTILVVLSVAQIWPELRTLKTLDAPEMIKVAETVNPPLSATGVGAEAGIPQVMEEDSAVSPM